jgi:hypothetical protein
MNHSETPNSCPTPDQIRADAKMLKAWASIPNISKQHTAYLGRSAACLLALADYLEHAVDDVTECVELHHSTITNDITRHLDAINNKEQDQ